jgi:hypothetical protein
MSHDIYDTLLKSAEDARMDCDKARLAFQRYRAKLQEALPDTVDLLGIVLGTGTSSSPGRSPSRPTRWCPGGRRASIDAHRPLPAARELRG